MAKRKIGEVLWLALECAKSDRQSLVDAYSGNTEETLEALAAAEAAGLGDADYAAVLKHILG